MRRDLLPVQDEFDPVPECDSHHVPLYCYCLTTACAQFSKIARGVFYPMVKILAKKMATGVELYIALAHCLIGPQCGPDATPPNSMELT